MLATYASVVIALVVPSNAFAARDTLDMLIWRRFATSGVVRSTTYSGVTLSVVKVTSFAPRRTANPAPLSGLHDFLRAARSLHSQSPCRPLAHNANAPDPAASSASEECPLRNP